MRILSSPVKQHFLYFAGGSLFGAMVAVAIKPDNLQQFLSYLTAYAGFLYLTIVLILAPINLLMGQPLGLSNRTRRNFGIWAGIFSVVHVGAGLTVHFGGRWWLYFLQPMSEGSLLPLRYDFFGAANYLGLIGAIVFCVLLAISNDGAIRKLGPMRWKRIQQLTYPLLLLVVVHGVIYQLLEKRPLVFLLTLIAGFVAVFILQGRGALKKRASGKAPSSLPLRKP